MGTLRYVAKVSAPLQRVYAAWANFAEYPKYFNVIEAVTELEDGSLQLDYCSPIGKRRTFVLRLTEELDERVIAFRSLEGLHISGSLTFEPAGAATYVTFILSYDPPAGRLGDIVSGWAKYPDTELSDSMERFRVAIEARADVSAARKIPS